MKRALATGALALSLCACPKEPEAGPALADDRTLQKLKAEQERLSKAGAPKVVTPKDEDPLNTAIAAPIKPEALGIPSGVAADLGPVALTLLEVQQSQTAGNGKVSLTTGERFLKVTLDAKTEKEVLELDLSKAKVINGDQEFALPSEETARTSVNFPRTCRLRITSSPIGPSTRASLSASQYSLMSCASGPRAPRAPGSARRAGEWAWRGSRARRP